MQPEQLEQIKVCEYVKQCTDLPFIHIANERKISPQAGALLKRMGVVAGASDIFIPRATKHHHGLFIELKTLKGKPSLSQLEFLSRMESEGYFGIVCYGATEAIDTIKRFYGFTI